MQQVYDVYKTVRGCLITLALLMAPLGTISSCSINGSETGTATQAVTVDLPPALAAYELGEGSGRLVADSSCSGNDGRINGSRNAVANWITLAPSIPDPAGFGNALRLRNGKPDAVQIDTLSLSGRSQATLSAWVYSTLPAGNNGEIVAKSDDHGFGWQLMTSHDQTGDLFQPRFACSFGSEGAVPAQRNSFTVVSLQTWYHVVCVYNGDAGTIDIYVSGFPDNLSGEDIGSVPASITETYEPAGIGRLSEGDEFWGLVKRVRVYPVALSPEQVQLDMETPVGPPDCRVTSN